MKVLINSLFIIIGAILFRIRGGWLDIWNNKIYYPIFIGFIFSYIFNWDIYLGIYGFINAYIAQQIFGWGAYRRALVAGGEPCEEVEFINDLLNKSTWLVNHHRVWGFCGCSLRGLISSFIIGSLAQSFSVALCGLLVGFCYLIPTLILWNTKYHNTKAAWSLGEFLEGALYVSFLLLWR